MTRADFIYDSLSFSPGQIVVVSGPDLEATTELLVEAQTAIEASTENLALVYDSRATILYGERLFEQDVTQAVLWEYMALMSEGQFVILVANRFIRGDERLNRLVSSLEADVVLDLMNSFAVRDLKYAYESRHGIREIYPFISKIYHFDEVEDEVTFIKNQTPERP